MKVSRPGKGGGAPGQASRGSKRSGGAEGATFSGAVEEAGRSLAEREERELDDLIDEIEEQGRVLAEKRTYTEMIRFRDLVTDFMNNVVKGSWNVAEVPSALFMENHKTFSIVRTVNEKLKELGETVLSDQKDAVMILGLCGEIKGLLLDLKK